MAIKITATKGSIVLMGAYLMIAQLQINKTVNKEPAPPEEDPDWVPHTVYTPETMYNAHVHIYPEYQERIEQYGAALIEFNVQFTHVDGHDIAVEAYDHIKANGIPGWTVNEMVDV